MPPCRWSIPSFGRWSRSTLTPVYCPEEPRTVEIVVRALVLFAFLWVVTRAVGRSTLGELSTFELLLYVTMGDLVQQGVTQQDYSLTGAVLAVSTFAVITVAVSFANQRWRRLLPITHGVPIIILRQGEPDLKA